MPAPPLRDCNAVQQNSKPLSKLAESLTRSSSTRRIPAAIQFLAQRTFSFARTHRRFHADGVDLAVVRHETERLRQPPRRLRVRRIPLVKNREGAVKSGSRKSA